MSAHCPWGDEGGMERIMKQTYKTGDKVKSNTTGSTLVGIVIQSYWHLDGENGHAPHMRHVVRWASGKIEDLWEGEISFDNDEVLAQPGETSTFRDNSA